MPRTAVILFNLGGPDNSAAVRPFLFNLFNDPAIIGVPQPLRWLIARLVSARRAPVAQQIYAHLGGGSPLLANTQAQADTLTTALADLAPVRVFACMRYWHPMSGEVAAAVKAFAPDRIVLLPLYPQFSSTTTASSCGAWQRAARQVGLSAPTVLVCCYPSLPGLVDALAVLTGQRLAEARHAHPDAPLRVLFSAHGLPKKIVARGDPYPQQVEETAAAVAQRLGLPQGQWQVCYQSRVGPLEWIGPATEAEIRRAGADGAAVVLVPIAFVSEHSETLVELDIEYRKLADESGVPGYFRVPAVGTAPAFIDGLADLVREALGARTPVHSQSGGRRCAADARCCLNRAT
jgi:ferrochelatase